MALRQKFFLYSVLLTCLSLISARIANACDFCPLRNAADIHICGACALEQNQTTESGATTEHKGKSGFKIGLSEQFTRFDNIQFEGRDVSNPSSQHLDSSITQLFGEYALSERLALQLNVPFINRSFRRVTDDGSIENGTESGVGDISLTGTYVPVSLRKKDVFFQWKILTGVKIPSGDASRLREESDSEHGHDFDVEEDEHELELSHEDEHGHVEDDHGHEEEGSEEHDSAEQHAKRMFRQVSEPGRFSAIHGHDLALGTGSFDFIFGTSFLVLKNNFFVGGSVQYLIRTEGDYDYEFADDLQWHVSPGVTLITNHDNHDFGISLAARFSGEFKDKDRFESAPVEDTRVTTLNLGPELDISIGENWLISAAVEFPLEQEASSLQIVPSHRVIVSLVYSL